MHTGRSSFEPDAASADVAVVGSGPVGLAVALDLADRGLTVVLVEAGPDDPIEAEFADPARHAALDLATRRAFGGTSLLWGGRCVPFDAIDFADRPHVAGARWPIGPADIAPFAAAAAGFLDCGGDTFETAWTGPPPGAGLRLDRLERWCAEPNMATVHGAKVRAHPRIRLATGTVVTRVAVDAEAGHVTQLETLRDGRPGRMAARAVILACGGLETTRLLLASRIERPALFGGETGPLGRHYMGHLFGSIADIVFTQPGLDIAFDFARDASGRYVRRRMTLTEDVQAALGLLNAAAWPEPPPIADPRHGSGILSMAALALAAPVLGPRLSPEAIRRRKLGPGPLRPLPHLGNVARDVVGAGRFAAGFLKARYVDPVRLPGFFVPNPGRRYDLHVHAEHAPDPESRVRLTDRRDRHGMPMPHVDLRYGEADARSAVRTIDELGARLADAGIARIEHRHPPEERVAALLAQASDGFHQIGTARMSADPRTGVVDGFGRVHGFSNLHLAGSAVFPSSGQANPTFLAVCLGLRLARHVAGAWRALPEPMAAE